MKEIVRIILIISTIFIVGCADKNATKSSNTNLEVTPYDSGIAVDDTGEINNGENIANDEGEIKEFISDVWFKLINGNERIPDGILTDSFYGCL